MSSTQSFTNEQIFNAIQINQNFWLALEDLEVNVVNLTQPEQIAAFEKFLSSYAVPTLTFQVVGEPIIEGIPAVATAFSDEFVYGFQGEHDVFTYPIVRQGGGLLTLYFNSISFYSYGDTNPGAFDLSRTAVAFNENLQIVSFEVALRANTIQYPTPITGWTAINFPPPLNQ